MGLSQLRSRLAEHERSARLWEERAAGLAGEVSALSGQLAHKREQLAKAEAVNGGCATVVSRVSQVEDDLRQLGANLGRAIGEDVSAGVGGIASGDAALADAAKSSCEELVRSLRQEVAALGGSLSCAQDSLAAAQASAAAARSSASSVRTSIRNYSED